MRAGILCYSLMLTALLFSCKKGDLDKPAPKPQIAAPSMILKGISAGIGTDIGGYFVGLPSSYDQAATQYPLILFFHGGGQFGNGEVDLPNLLSEGIPALLDTKSFPAIINAGGKVYSFIVLAPQFRSYPNNTDIQTFLDFAKANYRIDSSRIYVTGFSLGAKIACDYAGENPKKIAALVPMAWASIDELEKKCKNISDNKLPVWAFHNLQDELISVNDTKNFIGAINSLDPVVVPRLTIFDQSTALMKHDAWTRATDPSYRENGMNIYEWMLQFKR